MLHRMCGNEFPDNVGGQTITTCNNYGYNQIVSILCRIYLIYILKIVFPVASIFV